MRLCKQAKPHCKQETLRSKQAMLHHKHAMRLLLFEEEHFKQGKRPFKFDLRQFRQENFLAALRAGSKHAKTFDTNFANCRELEHAESVMEISPVLVRQHLRRENVPQNNSFSASDGEKMAGGRMRCPRFTNGRLRS